MMGRSGSRLGCVARRVMAQRTGRALVKVDRHAEAFRQQLDEHHGRQAPDDMAVDLIARHVMGHAVHCDDVGMGSPVVKKMVQGHLKNSVQLAGVGHQGKIGGIMPTQGVTRMPCSDMTSDKRPSG